MKLFYFRFTSAVLGIILTLLLVETGFRMTGSIMLASREIKNRRNLINEGNYRILCLGESTTAGQWPPFLEKELNAARVKIKFKVIDKGLGGTSTGIILSHLEEYLEAFKPHMVVVMMGINDGQWVWKQPLEYDEDARVRLSLRIKNMRLNKLANYIWEGMHNRDRTIDLRVSYRNADELYRETSDYIKAVETFKAQISADPNNPQAYVNLGDFYHDNAKEKEALSYYNEGIKAVPTHPLAYSKLANLYREMGQFKKAEKILKAGIECGPGDPWLLNDLARLYEFEDELEKAELFYKKSMESNPHDPHAYVEAGNLYRRIGQPEKAEALYSFAIKTDTKNPWIYINLGDLYRNKGEIRKMKALYAAGIKTNPENPWLYLELGKLHQDEGENEKAEALMAHGRKAARIIPEMTSLSSLFLPQNGEKDSNRSSSMIGAYPPKETIRNYQKLRDAVLKRGVRLVCMQYPLREVEPLKRILGPNNGIIYIENKDNFLQAIRENRLTDIFRDMFAGDFGHCTDFGNKLIATNLSAVILSEVFKD